MLVSFIFAGVGRISRRNVRGAFFFFFAAEKDRPLWGDLGLHFQSLFPASISNGLFYGCSTLYNKDWSLEDDILTRCDRKTKTKSDVHHELLRAASPMNSTESQFVQAVGIHTYPDALYLCSAWHAGLNQVCLGPGSKQRADLLVVDRGQTSKIHQIFWNYDRYRHLFPNIDGVKKKLPFFIVVCCFTGKWENT